MIPKFLKPGCLRLEQQYPPVEICKTSAYRQPISAELLPRISLVVPSLNQGEFLEATLRSILNQGYPNVELLLIDGGSTDKTVAVIEKYRNRLDYLVSEPDRGQADALNKGFARSTGDLMAWLNADDCLMPGTLFRVAEAFARYPRVDVVYGHRILMNEEGNEMGKWILPAHSSRVLKEADYVPQETLFWRRSIWERAGGEIDPSFQFAMDWDLLVRFMDAGAKFKLLPFFMGIFRVHESQKTMRSMDSHGIPEMQEIRERYQSNPPVSSAARTYCLARLRQVLLLSYLLAARAKEVLWKVGLIRIG